MTFTQSCSWNSTPFVFRSMSLDNVGNSKIQNRLLNNQRRHRVIACQGFWYIMESRISSVVDLSPASYHHDERQRAESHHGQSSPFSRATPLSDPSSQIQAFEWYSEGNGVHWKKIADVSPELGEMGITAMWLPRMLSKTSLPFHTDIAASSYKGGWPGVGWLRHLRPV